MALRVVIDRRYINRERSMVSINPKLRRIVMNKATREMMIEHYGKDFESVLLLIDPYIADAFWIMPCTPDQEGARALNATTGITRTISCSLLLNELNWKSTKTESYPVSWDNENNAAKVELAQQQTGGKEKMT